MNYTELEKANGILNRIKEIDFILKMIKSPVKDMKIGVNDYLIYFGSEHKKRFITVINEIRDEMLKELNELGVVENE